MKLSLLQWNVWVNEDPVKVANEIKRLDVDVVLAQELFENKQINPPGDTAATVANVLGWNYVYQAAETWDNKSYKTSQGNAIFSQYPLISSRSVYVQQPKHNPPNASKEGRVYIEAEIHLGHQRLTVGTVHLSYSHRFIIDKARIREADNLVKELIKHKQKYIFSGDLNAIPESYVIKRISETLTPAGPDFNQPTWSTKPFDHDGFKEDKLAWRLDYVFTTPDVKVVKSEIVETKVSDHLPIRVEVEI